jgi:flagellar hook assembly protein FlgD
MDASAPVYANSLSFKASAGILSGPYPVGKVTIKIKDVSGNVVRTLMDAVPCVKDLTYVATWDGRDSGGALAPDGPYTVEVTAVDMGECAAVNSLISGITSGFSLVNVDLTPPAVTITNPSNASWRRRSINIKGTVSDANPGGYSVGWGSSKNNISSGTGDHLNEILGTWETTGINGTFDINLFASDLAGNTAETKVSCNVDNDYPVISNLTFEVNSVPRKDFNPYSSNGITVRFTLSDNSFNGALYAVPAGGVNATVEVDTFSSARVMTFVNNSSLPSGQQQYTWTGQNDAGDHVNEGAYPFVIRLKDNAGNSIVSSSENIALWDDQRLTNNSLVSDWPRIDKGASDIHVVWEDNRSGNKEVYYKRSLNSGLTWEDGAGNLNADRRITANSVDDWTPMVKVNGDVLHLSDWTYTSPVAAYYKSTNKGGSWALGKAMGNGYSSNTCIGVNGNNLHMFFDDYDGTWIRIFYSRSTDGGATWSAIRSIAPASDAWRPSTAINGNNVHVVWFDTRAGAPKIYYRRSTDNGNTFTNGLGANSDRLLSTGSAESRVPQIAINGNALHIIWYDARNGSFEVYYKRSLDNGVTWDDGQGNVDVDRRLTVISGDSKYPAISVCGNIIHVVWHDNVSGSFEVYYKRSSDNGATWSSDIKLTNAADDSLDPAIVTDANNESYLAWSDKRDGNAEIYFQRIPSRFAPVSSPMMTSSLMGMAVGETASNSNPAVEPHTFLEINGRFVEKSGSEARLVPFAKLTSTGPISIMSFTTPECISPKGGVIIQTLRPEFKWYGLKGVMDYRIECAEASDEASLSNTMDYFSTTISYDQVQAERPLGEFIIPDTQTGLDENNSAYNSEPYWYWRVKAISSEGVATSETASFCISLPISISGVINYPNPFNPGRERTKIRYKLGREADEVTIRIYDITGGLVKELEGETNAEGSSIWDKYNEVEWDGRNGRGDMVRNGVYPFEVRASSAGKSVSGRGKIVVLK